MPPSIERGATERIDLHGARAEVHGWHSPAVSFAEAVAAIERARASAKAFLVVTAITRSNARVLSELPRFLRARGVGRWLLAWPRDDEDTPRRARFGLALPPALAALDAARRAGVEAQITGAPRCLLGPFARYALASPARSYAAPCEGCAARAACPGVDASYLARFGERELRALVDAPSPAEPAALSVELSASSLERR